MNCPICDHEFACKENEFQGASERFKVNALEFYRDTDGQTNLHLCLNCEYSFGFQVRRNDWWAFNWSPYEDGPPLPPGGKFFSSIDEVIRYLKLRAFE